VLAPKGHQPCILPALPFLCGIAETAPTQRVQLQDKKALTAATEKKLAKKQVLDCKEASDGIRG